ncbi:uncharacterized protein LOC133836737 [Drosophila sulfurigaster albostrigata]|uniref:uncharacterized protein LOC133836737 n=1 Tax=Drosophila sulfurigaster albostrigata TaxID=89887 RepID=UPI002D21D5B3|nr:uncharacterized protein LOC133836737 [Drosophila sulfurigaster albostrigata]
MFAIIMCIREMSRLICFLVLCTIVAVQAKFPDDPKPCKHGDTKCILNIINYLIAEESTTGVRELNLVKLDPLPVAKMSLKQGAESPVNIDLTFTDNNILGISTMKFTKVKGFGKDLAKKHELQVHANKLSLVGPYSIKGKVLILPISGNGKSNMTLVNSDVTVVFTGKPLEKNGETYMEATNMKILIKPERLYYYFSNLFNGDKALGDNMNAFLNDNWDAIFMEVQKSIQSAFSEIFQAIVSKVFSKYPYDKFFEASNLNSSLNLNPIKGIDRQLAMTVSQQEAIGSVVKMSRLIFIIVSCIFVTVQGDFPDDPKPCKHSDSECIKNVVNQLLHEKGDKGDVGLDLVKLDPYPLKKLSIQKGKDSPISIDLVFTDNLVHGLKNIKVTGIRGFSKDLTKRHEVKFHADSLSLIGPYRINGKVLILPISGKGQSNFTFENTDITVSFNGKPIERDGEIYMEPINSLTDANPNRLHYHFSNLFNGDKALGDNMNLFLNDNWEPIFKEVKPELQVELGNEFMNVIKKVFSKAPYNKLLVD